MIITRHIYIFMATLQLPYVCGGMCGVDGCPQEFHSEKELTMHCINEDETQVHTKRPFCDQCFMIFDETDNPVVHECEVGKVCSYILTSVSTVLYILYKYELCSAILRDDFVA